MSIVFNKSKEISLDDETLRSDLLKIASGMDNVIALEEEIQIFTHHDI